MAARQDVEKFKVLINRKLSIQMTCHKRQGDVDYMDMVKSRKGDVSDMTLAVLNDIRAATLD